MPPAPAPIGWQCGGRREYYALDANPEYWGGAPANRRIIVRHIKEAATQRLMLLRGDIDYARDLDADQLKALAGDRHFRFDTGVQTVITYLALNQRNPYLRRPEVIEAIKYLVDYDGMARAILGPTRTAASERSSRRVFSAPSTTGRSPMIPPAPRRC